MQYLTKSFYSKFHIANANNKPRIDTECCVNKLNKWLSDPDQQDVKVDNFSFEHDWSVESDHKEWDVGVLVLTKCRTKLTIIYHHV